MVTLGLKFLGYGCQGICKDNESNLGPWDQLLRLKLSRVKLYFRFACKMEFLLLFTFEGNIQYAKKRQYVWRQPRNAPTVINKIVFTLPEAMVIFSREKNG